MPANRIEGVDQLLKQLESLKLTEQKRVVAKALRRGANVIAEEIKRRAPVDSGRLRDSITVRITESTASEAIAKIGPSKKGFYGAFNERGTKFQTAHPFQEPAFQAKKQEAMEAIVDELNKHIRESI